MLKRDIRRLASLNRQLSRAVERGWEDDQAIIRAEIDAIMDKENMAGKHKPKPFNEVEAEAAYHRRIETAAPTRVPKPPHFLAWLKENGLDKLTVE